MANVPKVPGVPNLGSFASGTISLLAGDILSTLLNLLRPRWGIYQFGLPIVPCDNCVSVDVRQDWNVADFPVEEGGFQNYDKVTNPFSVRVRLSTGTDAAKRTAMLQTIRELCDSLDLVDIVTPEEIYSDVNLVHFDYRRNAQFAGLLVVDIWCQEVRQGATSSFTKSASSADIQNGGTAQAASPTPAQERSAASVQ